MQKFKLNINILSLIYASITYQSMTFHKHLNVMNTHVLKYYCDSKNELFTYEGFTGIALRRLKTYQEHYIFWECCGLRQ